MAETVAFIFDMDGTLVDNIPFHLQAWQAFLTEVGVRMSDADIQRHHHGKIAEMIRRMIGRHLSDAQVVALNERKEALYRELYHPYLRLIDGLKPFLDEAKHLHIPIALATSAGQDNIAFVLDGLAIRSYFDVVVGDEDVQHGKPDPEIFLAAAVRLGVPPIRCIVFEDSLAGIEAAYRAGMSTVVINTTLAARQLENWPNVIQVVKDYNGLHPASLYTKPENLNPRRNTKEHEEKN